ncbi:MAG TPA: hypothetical protein VG826_33040 [Pirellulales bacterium]|nr:hypothetical protein [Pirellulales bacterium]
MAGVTTGIAAAIGLRWAVDDVSMLFDVPPVANFQMVPAPSVAQVIEKHFAWADQQQAAGIAPQLAPIHEFFAEAQRGTRAFAEDALNFDSKWRYVQDFLVGGNKHRAYLEERFAARVFATDQLETTVRYAVQAYLDHLNRVDQALLVNLKADLENVPASAFSAEVDRQAVEQSMRAAVQQAVRAVESGTPGMVGREILSWVAGEVLAEASIKLATSAGILGVGASSGAVTFGAGIVLSLVVDTAVSWAYDEIFDPAGALGQELNVTLARLEALILQGDGENPGLYARLNDYAARRSQARNAAIKRVVLP